MAAYEIVLTPSARRQLAALDPPTRRRIASRIDALGDIPRPPGIEMLNGGEGQLRIRIGDWRVIYLVRDDDLLVLVITIGHRREIYRPR